MTGGTGNDKLAGGSGNDVLDGGGGSDNVNGVGGDDTLIYNLTANTVPAAKDVYIGGAGKDTLVLQFTQAQWLNPSTQTQVTAYRNHLKTVTSTRTGEVGNGSANDFVFKFGASSLTVQTVEMLKVFVDGVEQVPVNQAPTAVADSASVLEDGPAININVLQNDIMSGTLKTLSIASPPAHGSATLIKPDINNPSSWYVQYQANAADFQRLAAGETATDTFSYTLTNTDGNSSSATATVTITGTNDVVIVTSATQTGALLQDAASNVASGTISFSDVDLADSHGATFAAGANATALGTFALAPVSEAANAASGSVGWTYTLNNAAARYLAAGQVASETYAVTIDDAHGSSTTRSVVITITGTNDAVSITSALLSGSVVEDAASSVAGGTVSFNDVDLADTHLATVAASANATALGTFALGAVNEAANAASGSVGWNYTLNNAAAQYLAAGQAVSETYQVTIDDAHGSASVQDVVISVTGANDAVGITSAAQAGTVDAAGRTTTGTVSFADADLADLHSATFAAGANATALGTFALAPVSEAANAAAGSVGWTYILDDAAAQSLSAGQTVTETYIITIDDAHGSTAVEHVVITVTGTNHAVSITSGTQAGAVVEDAPSTASGTISFADADLADHHVATFAARANATALGSFALATVSESAPGGSVGWTYTLNNGAAQYLAAGQAVTETYTVTIDDAHGSTATQDVVITITGSNDAVTITSAAQTGAVAEDAAGGIASGTVSFADADLADSHAATFTTGANATALGIFAVSAATSAGSAGWTYTMNNAATQYLAAGQVASETYTVTIDDAHGSTATQDVVITITGSNDAVTITSAAQTGAVAEDAAGGIASGTVSFADADLTDSHTLTFAAGTNATALGIFAVSPATSAGNIGWTYTMNNAAAQYLSAGQVATETYRVIIDDAHGSTATQDVVITITGSNDAVTITSAAQTGAVAEDAAGGIASGTVSFADADLADSHAVTFAAGANATALGIFAVSAATSAGNIGWTYTMNNAAAQYLAAGQVASETYTIAIDDAHGSTATQDVVITITGSNDAVTITSAAQTGAVAEDATGGIASGTISFADADLADSHAVTFAAGANATALGIFAVSAATSSGSAGWTYTMNNAAAQHLAAGQVASETYRVTIDDAHGSTATQDVVITITGSNDAVTITSAAQTGAVAEDAAGGIASSTISFADADLTDSHAVTFAAGANATALGIFAVSPATSAGSAGWTYTMNNAAAQYLSAGQVASETYRVTIDDAHGSTATQDVVITITGSNDAVIVTSAAQTGAVAEDAANSNASGTVNFTDADLTDSHAITFTTGANATALGIFAVSPAASAGSASWSYTMNNAAAQYLAAGQEASETYTVTIDDAHGSTATQDVVITIIGSNDAVTITSAAQTGAVVEDAASGIASGTVGFADADLTDSHTATFAAGANATALGIFAVSPATSSGSVGWTYTMNNAAAQYLAAGQVASETYTIAIDDAHGSTATQDVAITITGVNDAVGITSAAQVSALKEDAAASIATGTVSFSDADLRDSHLATFAPAANATALGTFALAAVDEAADAAAGTVGWTYTLDNAAAQYLAAGQAVSETYTVVLDDTHGSTTAQNVVITTTGSNDAVGITSAAQTGALVQDAASNIATGNVSFSDPDRADTHVATFAAGTNATALGTFALATVDEAANAAAGSVGWTYTLNNAAARYLAAGQSASETYTVTIDDGHGASASQDIVITTTGINDAPTGTATATLAPGMQNTAYTVSESTLLQGFSDVDEATILHVASLSADHGTVSANANGTFTITPAADYSGPVILSYIVTDGSGGSIAATESFSLTASNRAPTGSATAALAAGREDVAYTLSASSLLTGFSDPDGDPLAVTGLSVTNGSVLNNGNGTFTITPAPNYSGVIGLNYSVTDGRGGTLAATQSISLVAVNDAPAGSDKTVAMVEDKAYTFKTADFGFSDSNDSPANALLALKLSTLPAAGTGLMLLNNAAVAAGAFVSASDIAAGKLTFVPADNYNNTAATMASLTFQVQDDGGVLNGGSNLDATPNTLSFLVAADNSDLGSGSPGTYTLSVNNGNVSILDNSGGKSLDQSTSSSNSFSVFNVERFSDNLELTGISGTSGSVRLTVLNQYLSGGGTTLDKMTFTNGGSVAGYALGTSSYDLFTSLTGTSNNDIIAGSSADDIISGNSGNDLLFGGAGNDRISGGAGRDLLSGGMGADRFYFNAALSASSNVDTIVDVAAGTDSIELSLAIFAAATATGGVLDASNFRAAAGGSALTSSQHILFDTSTGNLFYDADGSGSGAKVQFAQISLVGLSGTLSNTDFKLV